MDTNELDSEVRVRVYEITLERGTPPSISALASRLRTDRSDVAGSLQRLAAARALVLQPETGEILMANPFSAVPTPFLVKTGAFACYGNCIWDAFGIPAMLRQDAIITTSCPDCGQSMELRVSGDRLAAGDGVVHMLVPGHKWWDDIVHH